MNRRTFLSTAIPAFAAATLVGCATSRHRRDEAAVIDTHTHFYDPTRPQGVPWPPQDDKLLYRRVQPADYRALPVPRQVTGTVVVEASPWLEDNQWILDLAAREPFIVGFVGNLPAGTDEFAAHLKRFAANKIFRGIRIGAGKQDPWAANSALIRDLRQLADRDLSLDLLGGAQILPFAEDVARKIPNLRIIIDHLAGVTIDGKTPPSTWVRQMEALEPFRNIYAKLSGLVEGTGRTDGTAPRDVQFYLPVLNVMRKVFGPDRLIYASNWPVSARFAPLSTVQGIVEDYCDGQGLRVTEKIFSENSKAAYRWG